MSTTFAVPPELLRWAKHRSGRTPEYLQRNFPRLPDWEAGIADPTFEELQKFARSTYTPLGNFFLPHPPEINLGVPDFRTMRDAAIDEPSADLVEVVGICQARQLWYRQYAIENELNTVPFVGTIAVGSSVSEAAAHLRSLLSFDVRQRRTLTDLADVYRYLSERLDQLGVLVMKSGIVGNNTHRTLDPNEFRGFALVDEYAPLIFVNGVDGEAANIFTLCHEFIHLAIGQSALTNALPVETTMEQVATNDVERWCNRVAAEVLVPEQELIQEFQATNEIGAEAHRLSRIYRVSKHVILHSLKDAQLIHWDAFQSAYQNLTDAWGTSSKRPASTGGNFYLTEAVRVGRRFATALIADTKEGRTQYADAYYLLSTPRHETFDKFAKHMGVG